MCGQAEDAAAQFDACLELDPKFYLGLCGKAECLSMLGRFAEAEAVASAATELSPAQPRAFVNRGFARLKGSLPGAVADLEAAVANGDGEQSEGARRGWAPRTPDGHPADTHRTPSGHPMSTQRAPNGHPTGGKAHWLQTLTPPACL